MSDGRPAAAAAREQDSRAARCGVTSVVGGSFLLFIVLDALWDREGLPLRVWLVPGLYLLPASAAVRPARAAGDARCLPGALIVLDNSSYVREFSRSMTCPIAVSRRDPQLPRAEWTGSAMQSDPQRDASCRLTRRSRESCRPSGARSHQML